MLATLLISRHSSPGYGEGEVVDKFGAGLAAETDGRDAGKGKCEEERFFLWFEMNIDENEGRAYLLVCYNDRYARRASL